MVRPACSYDSFFSPVTERCRTVSDDYSESNAIEILRCRHSCTASLIARSSKPTVCRRCDAVKKITTPKVSPRALPTRSYQLPPTRSRSCTGTRETDILPPVETCAEYLCRIFLVDRSNDIVRLSLHHPRILRHSWTQVPAGQKRLQRFSVFGRSSPPARNS